MNESYELDLLRFWEVIKKSRRIICILIILSCLAAGLGTKFFVDEEYSATASIVIVSNETDQSMTYSDVQLSQKLTATYSRILMSESVGDKVIKNLGLLEKGFTVTDYKKIVSVSSETNTEILDVTATMTDPILAAQVTNETVKVFSNEVYDIMNVRNVTILDNAKIPTLPSGPNIKRNTLLGAAFGVLLSFVIVCIRYLKDTKVKSAEEIKKILGYPIIGSIPDIELGEKRAYYGR